VICEIRGLVGAQLQPIDFVPVDTECTECKSSGPHLQCHVGIEDLRAGAVRKFPQPENDLDM
jgi:hypothetical protein